MKNNMAFYEAGREVPPEAQKSFNNGSFAGTDINPMWRIKKLTEMFGPCGIGWYYEVVSERAEEHHDMTMAIVDLNLYIKVDGEWSKPIYGTGGNQLVKNTRSGQKASDEGYKMALTDALSVACKALGIGANIYFGKDNTKYTAYSDDAEDAPQTKEDIRKEIEKAKTNPLNIDPNKPAPGQIKYMLEHFGPNELTKYRSTYGENLEGMTREQAVQMVTFLQKREERKAAAMA